MSTNNLRHGLFTPSVFSLTINLSFEPAIAAETIRSKVERVLEKITVELKKHGCKLIGHIKALLDVGPDGNLFFSITEFDKKTKSKGRVVGPIGNAEFKLNIIVFQIKNDDIKKIVDACLMKGGICTDEN
jgi:hypothetical protein